MTPTNMFYASAARCAQNVKIPKSAFFAELNLKSIGTSYISLTSLSHPFSLCRWENPCASSKLPNIESRILNLKPH